MNGGSDPKKRSVEPSAGQGTASPARGTKGGSGEKWRQKIGRAAFQLLGGAAPSRLGSTGLEKREERSGENCLERRRGL